MNTMKKLLLITSLMLPTLAVAHPGHHHEASFWSGFMHPFTGLDHLVMVLGFGVLMWSMSQKGQLLGIWGLLTALVFGFIFGGQGLLPVQIAEYGIVASLLLVAISLWRKTNASFAVAAVTLAVFHGTAHGAELAANGKIVQQLIGMLVAMTLIYSAGLGLGALLNRYMPQGKKILAGLAALVAVLGLA